MGFITTAFGLLTGRRADKRGPQPGEADFASAYDPDLECFLLQMSVLSDARMKEWAQELSAVGFERRQQGYEAAERHLDYVLRCQSVTPEVRAKWVPALMYTLRCEVERQDLAQLMKRTAARSAAPQLAPAAADIAYARA